jgi:hypothetical protein
VVISCPVAAPDTIGEATRRPQKAVPSLYRLNAPLRAIVNVVSVYHRLLSFVNPQFPGC